MDAERDELGQAFRAIARDDAEDAARSAPRLEARLMEQFRASRSRRPARLAPRIVGLAMAAALVGALAAPVWMVTRGVSPAPLARPQMPAASTVEITTAFMPLAYDTVPFTDARLVRLEVPRAALAAFGLAPIDAMDVIRTDTVLADVVVGEDGLARAVRFVRAPRAPGVAP
jgi:hypothetical protein